MTNVTASDLIASSTVTSTYTHGSEWSLINCNTNGPNDVLPPMSWTYHSDYLYLPQAVGRGFGGISTFDKVGNPGINVDKDTPDHKTTNWDYTSFPKPCGPQTIAGWLIVWLVD